MEERYARNHPAISPEEQAALKDKRVIVLGCGGLGGYIIENLVRMGVGNITAVDGDVFDVSNLNRQLLSSSENLGCGKAAEASKRAAAVNPEIRFEAVSEFFHEGNADALIQGHDLVMDALDNIETRLLMEERCAKFGVPIVHGAINAWLLQVAVVMPGSGILRNLYASGKADESPGSPAMTVQCCAAIQCAEALKLLCGRQSSLEGKLLCGDLRNMEWLSLSI